MRSLAIAALVILAGSSSALAAGRLLALDRDGTLYTIDRYSAHKSRMGYSPVDQGGCGAMTCPTGTEAPIFTIGIAVVSVNCCYHGGLGETYYVDVVGGVFADTSISMHAIEWIPSQDGVVGVSNTNLYTIDLSDGSTSLIGNAGVASPSSLVHDSVHFDTYMTSSVTDSLYVIDTDSAAATLVGPLNGPTNPTDLAYVPEDDAIYLVCSDTDMLYTVDRATGAATAIGSTGPGELIGLAWVPAGPPPTCMNTTGCWCDYDGNGGVDGGDFYYFIVDYEAGSPCADMDQDGGITPADLAFFFDGFDLCCC